MKKKLLAVLLVLAMLVPMGVAANAETVFEITGQPGDIEAPVGATGFTSVKAAADGKITYRWYYQEAYGGEWIDTGKIDTNGAFEHYYEGYDSSTLYVPVTESSLGQRFYCLLTDEDGNTLETDVVTVGEGLTSTITVDRQPEDIWAAAGETGMASVEATVESEPIVEISYIYPEAPAAPEPEPEPEPAAETPEETNEEPAEDENGEGTETPEGEDEPYQEPETPAEQTPVEPIEQKTYIERTTRVTYQWLYLDAAGAWRAAEYQGSGTSTISVPVTAENDGQQFKCLIRTADGGRAETDVVTVHMTGTAAPANAEEPAETTAAAPVKSGAPASPAGITIVTQPADIISSIGTTGTATVEAASDAELSYQWYFRRGSSAWQVSGFKGCKTDTISVPVTAARIGQQYKCVITTADGGSIETNVVTVYERIPAEITIVTQPADIKAKTGTTGTATVEAASEAELSYQWYFRRGTGAWSASGFEGCKTDTISVPVTAARIGQQYKCVITSSDGVKVETDVVTVGLPDPSAITIVTQPADIQGKLGQNGTATVEAVSDAELSYRWYFKAKNSEEWKPSGFEGCKTDTISVPVATGRVGQQYKCVITTDDGGRIETEAVSVLAPLPSEITIETQPADMYGSIGYNVSATVKASADTGAALRYQWYFKSKGSETWQASGMTGNKTAAIQVPVTAARIGQQYKCVITTADGGRAETEPVTIRESISFTIVSQPDSYEAYEGAPVELLVSASENSGLAYQWYKDGAAIEGAASNRLYITSVTAEDAGEYYCVVSGAGHSETCNPATVTVLP